MTAQEHEVLGTFLNQLVQARVAAKDPQAAAMIHDAVGQQPDAAYLLVQKVLLLDRALSQAKMQLTDLQAQLQAARSPGNADFIDSASSWGNTPSSAATGVRVYPAQGNSTPLSARPGFLSDGLRSTLGNIATTAAGVAGGALLFEGIEHLIHHNSGSSFLGAQSLAGVPSETTVVNNYYDRAAPLTTERGDPGFFDDIAGDFDSDDNSLI